jgi:hypothetical protein
MVASSATVMSEPDSTKILQQSSCPFYEVSMLLTNRANLSGKMKRKLARDGLKVHKADVSLQG